MTKRACEDLAAVYATAAPSVVGLRYFTVCGPRQRPDMAMRKLCEALLDGASFPLYGDGSQSRDFTPRTAADTTRAAADLGWRPTVGLRAGLRSQLDWVAARRATQVPSRV